MSKLLNAVKWLVTIEKRNPRVHFWATVVWIALLLYFGYGISFGWR
jgi:hypothetical protein